MTEFQRIMLRRLAEGFGVDIAEASALDGAALDAWLARAEDQVFEREQASLRAQRMAMAARGSQQG